MTSKQSLRDKCRTQKYVKMQTAKAGKISIINSFEKVSCSKVSFHTKTRSKYQNTAFVLADIQVWIF